MSEGPLIDPAVAELVVRPSRSAWLASRRSTIGASESAALFLNSETGKPASPWLTELSLYASKVAPDPDPDAPEEAPDEAQDFGLFAEPFLAARAAHRLKLDVRAPPPFSHYRSVALPILSASPDRFSVEPAGVGVLELKTTESWNAKDWKDEAGAPSIPLHIEIQVQHQLAVLGLRFGRVAALIGRRFEYLRFERNDEFIEALLARVAEFWRRVEARDPPAAISGDYDAAKLLFPKSRAGSSVKLGDRFCSVLSDWYAADAARKAAEAKAEACKAELAMAIGDFESAVLPDGARLTFKLQRRVTPPQPEKVWSGRVLLKPRAP